tara:strand:- start:7186 stop:8991 length:1806 start_codon:yes stop_codon:yes gene_type:complete
MNTFLAQRISSLMADEPEEPIAMRAGGEVFGDEMVEELATPESMMQIEAVEENPAPPDEALISAIDGLMAAQGLVEDQGESEYLKGLTESAVVGSQAPLADMAIELSQAGRGEDTTLAHLTPGEVVLPTRMMSDPEFERAVGRRFAEVDLDPEAYVVGGGIASLNPITGLEEFGVGDWWKKTRKSAKKAIKKIVRPVAQVAQFIPGPWQPLAAIASKAGTVYDAVKGDTNPLLAVAALTGATGGGSLFDNLGALQARSAGSDGIMGLLEGIGGSFKDTGLEMYGGLKNLRDPAKFLREAYDLGTSATFSGERRLTDEEILANIRASADLDPAMADRIDDLEFQNMAAGEILRELELPSASFFNPTGQGNVLSEFIDDQLGFDSTGRVQDFLFGSNEAGTSSGLGSLFGGGGALSNLLPLGIAGILAKLAYDEAKDQKGVPLIPLTQMDAYGRYNIADEIARREGGGRANPVEFGLLPANTMPTLSGGRRKPETATGRYGGHVMAYANGGNVSAAEFVEMDGGIDGEGTEISDEVPAMLSDGEFVMTGQAVRGAGAFDMSQDGGIITLTPSGSESRDQGTQLMYKMMDIFSGHAEAPAETTA